MPDLISSSVVGFGIFEINLRSGELRKHGLRIQLPGQPFTILALLIGKRGEIVTREELKKALWPKDTFVDFEHSLNSAIKKLREALNDSADTPRYIETVPRLGYRFIPPVQPIPLPETPMLELPRLPVQERLGASIAAASSHKKTNKTFAFTAGFGVVLLALVLVYLKWWRWKPPLMRPSHHYRGLREHHRRSGFR